jgi:hypothetical protein
MIGDGLPANDQEPSTQKVYTEIRAAAKKDGLAEYPPKHYEIMNETRRYGLSRVTAILFAYHLGSD